MDRRFHIIITSEQCQARTFTIAKRTLKQIMVLLGIVGVISLIAGATYTIERFNLKKIDSLENHVANLSNTNRTLQGQRKTELANVYGELSQRSRAIESILATLGIKPAPTATGQDSGGPFTSLSARPYDDLIAKVDQDLETIRPLPLGYPIQTLAVSSGFGARSDPVNGEKAFHEGIDLRGNPGAMIKATADGKVVQQGYSDDYGWYVQINHGNEFTTLYAHNQKILVRQGDRVTRGQTIAWLGNTGRSTGAHLHYEIRRNGRPVNPGRYLNIAKLFADNLG